MAAFCPLFPGVGGWSFDEPTTTTTTTTLYSQDQPLFYFNNAHHQIQDNNNHNNNNNFNDYFPYIYDQDQLFVIPSAPTLAAAYNQTTLPAPPQMGGGQEPLQAPAGFSIHCGAKAGPATEEAEKKRKMYHNASERDRRKKINSMYSSLRSVLPATDRMKTLSNPDTVTRAVKYIPELQKKVKLLSQKKHHILSMSTTSSKNTSATSSHSVQATQLGNAEILLQISTVNHVASTIPVSEVITEIEEDLNMLVMDVSSQSSAARILINLVVKVASHEIDCELLKKKVLNSCQNWEIKFS